MKTWEEAVLWLKNQPDKQELVRACFYDDPLIEAAKRYYESSEWRACRDFLPDEKGSALDIGAGRGIASYALAKDGWQVTALEPDGSHIVGAAAIRELAKQADIDIDVVERWGEALPFDDNCFDLVFCRQALHHARDLGGLCREIGRVLKSGGFFLATREHVISKKSDLDTFLKNHPLHRLYGGEMAYRLDEYRNAIKSAGICIDRELNPFESDINLFPDTIDSLRRKLARKLKLPFFRIIPVRLVRLTGFFVRTPGRLYTFIGYKR